MAKTNLTRSADLHLRIGAFGALFSILIGSFHPLSAFTLALVAAGILAKL
ncbi:hypothetical protein [Nitrosomonas nitrosa]|uniref:Uncharacterized protein n=1 Tax=Nitrosomonas nitrosa TaxID=52442 RepID=A0A1I4TNI6_9PROT|nr:hypothetical protein [Nitrosomonas nitrosa]MCO6433478.1 hypothetical protein [Nitrosomonas nitrosa]SFM78342.1 hypothetical protein SAMN05421880_13328 [Nitrosomonas nitrosa]